MLDEGSFPTPKCENFKCALTLYPTENHNLDWVPDIAADIR